MILIEKEKRVKNINKINKYLVKIYHGNYLAYYVFVIGTYE